MNAKIMIIFILITILCAGIAQAQDEWSDITPAEGNYSYLYTDFTQPDTNSAGTFYCMNDWFVNSDDGGQSGGMLSNEYNEFNFRIGSTEYQIRIYPDTAVVEPNTLTNFISATGWGPSPNSAVAHTMWEWQFDIMGPDTLEVFNAWDPKGADLSKTVNTSPPPPRRIINRASSYPHITDGVFSDTPQSTTPPVPSRDYLYPEKDPNLPKYKMNLLKGGGMVLTPQSDIPTVSHWGLAVLTLLLLSAAALVIRRRRRAMR
ncbi:IPTL-CTERM sorting domain-containing protein [Candidatus Pacearchaeota archaeon]|nr:IPTL-CTERM sorting domain-containing protein [Candidatus Pacearchaeota archaeon]